MGQQCASISGRNFLNIVAMTFGYLLKQHWSFGRCSWIKPVLMSSRPHLLARDLQWIHDGASEVRIIAVWPLDRNRGRVLDINNGYNSILLYSYVHLASNPGIHGECSNVEGDLASAHTMPFRLNSLVSVDHVCFKSDTAEWPNASLPEISSQRHHVCFKSHTADWQMQAYLKYQDNFNHWYVSKKRRLWKLSQKVIK